MNILVVGGGGREHAIIKKIKENKKVTKIYALPGNGGIATDAECIEINTNEIEKIKDFAVENEIDFAVVAPDDPLVLGAVDLLEENGIPCFGPNKAAAEIEGSKVFSKNLMKKYNIPTADYNVFYNSDDAIAFIKDNNTYPIVIKADGLALGKGVIIAEDEKPAIEAIISIMSDKVFGNSGNQIVIEEFLTGPEVSVLSFTDGITIVPMVSSMDHKKAFDDDQGLNTGGMGTIAPNPYYTDEIANLCMKQIFVPTINAMNAEARSFKGCLYFGLILTTNGPKVIEYNCRFGDPETQVVLPLLKTDLLDIMIAVSMQKLDNVKIEFDDEAACCVILASGGYPVLYKKGYEITIDDIDKNIQLYHAGTKLLDGKLVTTGGRVIGVVAIGNTLFEAIKTVYLEIPKITFTDCYYRKDIGTKALNKRK
ncbi:MAG: phosphoribosylamine--glycine ligase [Clostridiales bacterium GWF2_38_85]|nr:MAG: phosphoribosylamine--glycine ligase [Clostridiales bacterium GWF2_38_85]